MTGVLKTDEEYYQALESLAGDKIFICKNCEGILKEFALYRWDERSAEDKVIKEHDHAMDEMHYFCYKILRNKLRR